MNVQQLTPNVYKLSLVGQTFKPLEDLEYSDIQIIWGWSCIEISEDNKTLTVVIEPRELDIPLSEWLWVFEDVIVNKDELFPKYDDTMYLTPTY